MISALVALTGLVVSPGMPLSTQARSSMNVAMVCLAENAMPRVATHLAHKATLLSPLSIVHPRTECVLPRLKSCCLISRRAKLERDITKIPTKNVWVSFAEARDCKPGTVVSGFKYGQVMLVGHSRISRVR